MSRWYSKEQNSHPLKSTNSMSHQDSQAGPSLAGVGWGGELRQACTTEVHTRTHTHTNKARHTTSTGPTLQLHASSLAHCAVSSSIADSDPTPATMPPVGACIVHGTLTDGGRVHCAPTTPGGAAWVAAGLMCVARGLEN